MTENQEKAIESLLTSSVRLAELKKLSDEQLSKLFLEEVWAKLPLSHLPSDVADELHARFIAMTDEKRRRVYYQDIVYAVCNQLDRAFAKRITRGEGTVCGTVDNPTTQVQDLTKELVDRDHLRAMQAAQTAAGEAPFLEGRRCPKCQSLMYHTRLGGYRCQRGCQ